MGYLIKYNISLVFVCGGGGGNLVMSFWKFYSSFRLIRL